MTALPVPGFFTDSARINSEAKTAWDNLLEVHRQLQGGDARTELTIATGSVTPTLGIHTVDTESDAATDFLDNIVQTNHPDGRLLIISAEDGARDVVVRDAQGGAGQILTADSANITLTTTDMRLILQRVGTNWEEVGRFYGTDLTAYRAYLELGTAAVLNTGTAESNIPLVSDALMQGKHTIWVPAGSMVPKTTNGAARGLVELATNDIMLDTLDFDTTTEEFAMVMIAMPKSWDEGTITFQPLWTAASGSGGVVFRLAAYALSDSDAIDSDPGSGVAVIDTFLTANDLHIAGESGAVTIAGTPAENDLVAFEMVRVVGNGSDTLAVDAKLIGIRIFITIDDGEDT